MPQATKPNIKLALSNAYYVIINFLKILQLNENIDGSYMSFLGQVYEQLDLEKFPNYSLCKCFK